MSDFVKTTKINYNKKGEEVEKMIELKTKSKNKKITLKEVNNIYKKLIEKTDANNFMIKAMTIDGFKTLKSFNYDADDLSHSLDDYYSSLPKEAKDKFEDLLYVQIIKRL